MSRNQALSLKNANVFDPACPLSKLGPAALPARLAESGPWGVSRLLGCSPEYTRVRQTSLSLYIIDTHDRTPTRKNITQVVVQNGKKPDWNGIAHARNERAVDRMEKE